MADLAEVPSQNPFSGEVALHLSLLVRWRIRLEDVKVDGHFRISVRSTMSSDWSVSARQLPLVVCEGFTSTGVGGFQCLQHGNQIVVAHTFQLADAPSGRLLI